VLLQAGSFYLNGPIEFNGQNNVTLRGAGANQTFLYFFLPAGNGHDIGLGSTDTAIGMAAQATRRIGPPGTLKERHNHAGQRDAYRSRTDHHNPRPVRRRLQRERMCDRHCNRHRKYICLRRKDRMLQPNRWIVVSKQSSTATAGSGDCGEWKWPLHRDNFSGTPHAELENFANPGAWWPNNTINGDGVEDLSADNTGSDSSSGGVKYTFDISQCYGCWVKGVRGINGNMDHVIVYLSLHCTVANNLFYGTKNAATQSYGVSVFEASDNLLINNAFSHVTSAVTSDSSSTGNVYAYNFANDEYYSTDSPLCCKRLVRIPPEARWTCMRETKPPAMH